MVLFIIYLWFYLLSIYGSIYYLSMILFIIYLWFYLLSIYVSIYYLSMMVSKLFWWLDNFVQNISKEVYPSINDGEWQDLCFWPDKGTKQRHLKFSVVRTCPVKFQNRERGIEFCRFRKIISLGCQCRDWQQAAGGVLNARHVAAALGPLAYPSCSARPIKCHNLT